MISTDNPGGAPRSTPGLALRSMTGFARADGATGQTSWHWEVRSVNGRGLDLRLRVPGGYEALEPRLREACARKLTRGNVSISLNVRREAGVSDVRLNEAVLGQVLVAVEKVRLRHAGEAPSIGELLSLKGVLESVEASESEAEVEARLEAMMRSFAAALDGVVAARSAEGARLGAVLAEQMQRIEALVEQIERAPARTPDAIKVRLREQVQRLTEGTGLDEARLYQEAVLVAARVDVEEEIKRLRVHIASARELFAAKEAVGRRLDFLAQEFNREANTICSKANDSELTKAGLELKAVIDQFREQVQNIE